MDTSAILQQECGDRVVKKSRVCYRHKHFHDRCRSVVSDLRSDCPAMSTNEENVECVREIVRSDRRKSVAQTASEVGISIRSFRSILHDVLNMFCVHQHLVSWMLAPEQKETQISISGDLISTANEDIEFINNIITGDDPQKSSLLNGNHHHHHLVANNLELIGVKERWCS